MRLFQRTRRRKMHCFPHGETFLLVCDSHASEQAPKYRAALVPRMCSWQPCYNLLLFGHLISLGKVSICILSAEAKHLFSLKVSWISLLGLCPISSSSSVAPCRRCRCTHVSLHGDMGIKEDCLCHHSCWDLWLWEDCTHSAFKGRDKSRHKLEGVGE